MRPQRPLPRPLRHAAARPFSKIMMSHLEAGHDVAVLRVERTTSTSSLTLWPLKGLDTADEGEIKSAKVRNVPFKSSHAGCNRNMEKEIHKMMGNFAGLASDYNKESLERGTISPSQKKTNMQKWPRLLLDVSRVFNRRRSCKTSQILQNSKCLSSSATVDDVFGGDVKTRPHNLCENSDKSKFI